MRQPGAAKSGMKFLGDGAAADDRATLQHERLVSSLGQIKGSNQPIVSGSENDDVACLWHKRVVPGLEPVITGAYAG